MPIEAGMYQYMKQDPGVSSYVGGRIFGSKLPKDKTAMPAIVWTVVLTQELGSHAHGSSGLRSKRFQIDSYASKYMDSVKTSDAVRALFQNFSGTLPDGSSVNGCIIIRDMDFPYEPGTSGYVYRHLLEIDVIYSEYVTPFIGPNVTVPGIDDIIFDTVEDDGQP